MRYQIYTHLFLLLFTFLGISVSCGRHRTPLNQEVALHEFQRPDTLPKVPVRPIYAIRKLETDSVIDSLRKSYTPDQLEIIFAINRIDSSRVRRGTTIIIPDTLFGSLSYYAPFPIRIHAFDTIPKIILVSQRIQAFAAYQNGKLSRWGPVSSGKRSTPTPNGLYHTNWKIKSKRSTVNNEWILPWYFNIHNTGGIALHQYELPGYPASHSCVRLRETDARWFYDWADQWQLADSGRTIVKEGTPVVIYGTYNYDTIRPWLQLAGTRRTEKITSDEITGILDSARSGKSMR